MNNNKNIMIVIKQRAALIGISLLSLISTTPVHADFRKALDALQRQDGKQMLAEVKSATEKKQDDGIILFLSILKQYPKTWRPTFTDSQLTELFTNLEKATAQTSLQSQYHLAVIPRKAYQQIPITAEVITERQEEIQRLIPLAEKGYAPAALKLYGHYAHPIPYDSKPDNENSMKWLKSAAELGNAEAAFFLGIKYLNIKDNQYGCNSNQTPPCPLSKDETQGWHWMQRAAKHADEPSILLLDDFASHMGDLYMQGVAGNKPDYEQAYLWYQRMPNGLTPDISPVWPKLEALQKLGKLKLLNPNLDKAWGNATKWQEAVKSKEVTTAWQNSHSKPPKLLQQKAPKCNSEQPVFSMTTIRWYHPNSSYAGIVLDVYQDGHANLLIGEVGLSENNDELWTRLAPNQAKQFINEVNSQNLENMPWVWPSCVGCIENRTDFVTLNHKGIKKTTKIASARFADKKISPPEAGRLQRIVEKYYPLYKLLCDADAGDSKSICNQIYQDILSPDSKGEK